MQTGWRFVNEVALHGFAWSLVKQNLTRYCVTQFAWWCIVLSCIDTIEMILGDWRNTAAGPSENLKRLVSVVVVHCKYTIIHTIIQGVSEKTLFKDFYTLGSH